MDDSKLKYKNYPNTSHHIGLDYIHPQTHSSPYHVHPYPSPVRLQHAFQPIYNNSIGITNNYNKTPPTKHAEISNIRNYSYITPTDSPILGHLGTPRASPVPSRVPSRVSQLSDRMHDSLSIHAVDTDTLVSKISAMFPTASETHIKILLKKYYNREAVVISALQVEKHPIATPGPVTSGSPSVSRLQRSAFGVYSALQLAKAGSAHFSPLTGSPQGSPLLRASGSASSYYGSPRTDGHPRPHSSPKMKLRYLKSVFPKADETLILDILANKDNNVQKASEELMTMGFTKRENALNAKAKDKEPIKLKPEIPRASTPQEKSLVKAKLQKKYNTIAERLVSIALESVNWNEERAEQILTVVLQEEQSKVSVREDDKQEKILEMEESDEIDRATLTGKDSHNVISQDRSPTERPKVMDIVTPLVAQNKFGSRRQKCAGKQIMQVNIPNGMDRNFNSPIRLSSKGPNDKLHKGAQDNLLLIDYLPWNGPHPEFRSAPSIKSVGPDLLLRSCQGSVLAKGPSRINKGPVTIAKGSIYKDLTKSQINIKFWSK